MTRHKWALGSLVASLMVLIGSPSEAESPFIVLCQRGDYFACQNLIVTRGTDRELAVAHYQMGLSMYPQNRARIDPTQAAFLSPPLPNIDDLSKIDPTDFSLLLGSGSPERMIWQFTKAIGYDPSYAEAYMERGRAYGSQGKYAEAAGDLDEVVRLNPSDQNVRFLRGEARYQLGQHEGVIDDMNAAIASSVLSGDLLARAQFVRGSAHLAKNTPGLALADLNQSVALRPNWVGYRQRALAHAALGNADAARKDFGLALKLDPPDAERQRILTNIEKLNAAPGGAATSAGQDLQQLVAAADAHTKAGRLQEAVAVLTQLIDLRPIWKVFVMRARLHAEMKNVDQALADYQDALNYQAPPEMARGIRVQKFKLMYETGDLYGAASEIDNAILIESDAAVRSMRAQLFVQMGWFEEASEDLTAAIAHKPDDPLLLADLHVRRARLFAAAQDIPAAINDLNIAIGLNPHPTYISEREALTR